MLIEPTETEGKQMADELIATIDYIKLKKLKREMVRVSTIIHLIPKKRLDEVKAAKIL